MSEEKSSILIRTLPVSSTIPANIVVGFNGSERVTLILFLSDLLKSVICGIPDAKRDVALRIYQSAVIFLEKLEFDDQKPRISTRSSSHESVIGFGDTSSLKDTFKRYLLISPLSIFSSDKLESSFSVVSSNWSNIFFIKAPL